MLLYQLLRDMDDEITWIAEKEPQASSTDLGNSLTSVQSLQKNHQVLITINCFYHLNLNDSSQES